MALRIIINIVLISFIFTELHSQESGFLLNSEINQYDLEDILNSIGRTNKKDSIKVIHFIKNTIYLDNQLKAKLANKDSLIEFLNNSDLFNSKSGLVNKFITSIRTNSDFERDTNNNLLYNSTFKFRGDIKNFSFSANILNTEKINKTPDYYSGYIDYNIENFNLILGDFTIKSGLGTLFGNQFRQSDFETSIDGYNKQLSYANGFSSTYNGNNLSGIYIEKDLKLGKSILSFSGFYSSRRKSGLIIDDTIHSIHLGENEDEKNIQESTAGILIEANYDEYKAGINSYFINYNLPINSSNKSNIFGKSGLLSSVYLSKSFSNKVVIGELGLDNELNPGLVMKFIHNTDLVDYYISTRYFSRDFNSPFGINTGSKSAPNNEIGISSAIKINKTNFGVLTSSFDYFKEIESSNTGWNLVLNLEKDFKNNVQARLSLRLLDKYNPNNFINGDYYPLNNMLKLKSEFKYLLNKNFKIGLILDYITQYENQNTINSGYGAKIYLNFKIKNKLFLSFSSNLYSTDNYQTAIWYLERMHENYYLFQANYLEGSRISTNIDYNINYLVFSIKYLYNESIFNKFIKKENKVFGELKINF